MEPKPVHISICIPAYKRPDNIRRLLRSIAIQSFRDYEIVISDDSPNESVSEVVSEFDSLPIRYFRNTNPLGTPNNWNHAIAQAQGTWIKVMHDDDWFATDDALEKFSEATKAGVHFIFSKYRNVFQSGEEAAPAFPNSWHSRIRRNPVTLLSRNVIGPPSVTLVHRSLIEKYDVHLKWRVDIDYYIRILYRIKNYVFIPECLVHVGISITQVTNDCIDKPEVELPEGLMLLKKYGTKPLRNILVYDAWWRIIRNVGVRSLNDLQAHTPGETWPPVIIRMVAHQSRIPRRALRIGPVSKLFMSLSYMLNRKFQ